MVIYVLGELASAPAAYWEASGSALGEVLLESFLGDFSGKLTGELFWGSLLGIANRLSILFPGAYNS